MSGGAGSGTRAGVYGQNRSGSNRRFGSGPREGSQTIQRGPIPSYMKPKGAVRERSNRQVSNDRSGSLQTRNPRLPTNYKPPHLRNNFVRGNSNERQPREYSGVRNNSGPR